MWGSKTSIFEDVSGVNIISSIHLRFIDLMTWKPTLLFTLTDVGSDSALQPSSSCWSACVVQRRAPALPCLSSQFSFSIHRPGSGSLQPFCTLSVPFSSLCITVFFKETAQSTALSLRHVGPQRGAFSGGALPCAASL